MTGYSKARKRSPLTVIRDTREQYEPAWPEGIACQTAKLDFADYSAEGLTDYAALELKWSLSDLIVCCTYDRDRFDAMLRGLAKYPVKAIIVADRLEAVHAHRYRSDVPPRVIVSSTWAWAQDYGVPTVWAGSPEGATNAIVWWLQRAQSKAKASKQPRIPLDCSAGETP